MGFFPPQERLINGADTASDAQFLVDIGGSVGHYLLEFKTHSPSHPGQLVDVSLFCSKERTEADWRNLLETKAGLKIINIWSGGNGVESLIGVELP